MYMIGCHIKLEGSALSEHVPFFGYLNFKNSCPHIGKTEKLSLP